MPIVDLEQEPCCNCKCADGSPMRVSKVVVIADGCVFPLCFPCAPLYIEKIAEDREKRRLKEHNDEDLSSSTHVN